MVLGMVLASVPTLGKLLGENAAYINPPLCHVHGGRGGVVPNGNGKGIVREHVHTAHDVLRQASILDGVYLNFLLYFMKWHRRSRSLPAIISRV